VCSHGRFSLSLAGSRNTPLDIRGLPHSLAEKGAKPSHDDISPAPDADSTSLGSPSVLLTSSQKKRLKKKKAIQAKAKLDAKAQCDSQRVSLNYVLSNMTLG